MGKLYYQTTGGLYWSSNTVGNASSYGLGMNNIRLDKAGINNKRRGSPLRCVVSNAERTRGAYYRYPF